VPGNSGERLRVAALCAVLAALVLGVFWRTSEYGFVNYDDDQYVYDNPLVTGGLSWEGVQTAATYVHSWTWHPLTTLSHMLDCELFGLDPAGHHLTNVLIHALTVVLLLLVLRSMTGALWCSAFVALIFALHPLRIESVAWISERKDVLSGLFFMLTLGAYLRYSRRVIPGSRFPLGSYLLALLCFALGLLSKPMLVTLPFVLLLLDFWPLGRLRLSERPGALPEGLRPVLLEKLPFLALSAAASAVTLRVQAGVMTEVDTLSWAARIGNALVSYVIYIRQLFVPVNLAVVYPHARDGHSLLEVGLAALLLLALTAAAIVLWRRKPFLLVGWLWFLGMLLPVIGLVQVGVQAHADRYTYLPQIGLLLSLTFLVAEARSWKRSGRRVMAVTASVAVAASIGLTWSQTGHWKSSESLWRHALANTRNNSTAHSQLGVALAERGLVSEALEQYRLALAIQPDYATPRYNLGNILAGRGDLEGAVLQYRAAIRARPDYAKAHGNLGAALLAQARVKEAIDALRRALELAPDSLGVHLNIARALEQQGDRPGALAHLRRALELALASGDRRLADQLRSQLERAGEAPAQKQE